MEKVRGGAREGAGRKAKADEQSLIEKLSPLEGIAFEALTNALNDGKDWAVKLFFQYKFGMPKQTIDQKVEVSNFDISRIYDKETPKALE